MARGRGQQLFGTAISQASNEKPRRTAMFSKICIAIAIASAVLASDAVAQTKSTTIDTIKRRGSFKCGMYENVPGIASLDDKGEWIGFDVDYCRAMAAAILGDGKKVEFVKLSFPQALPSVRSGEVEMAGMAITDTILRQSELGFDFVGPTLYSGEGFMVHKSIGATKLTDLDGATICIVAGTINERLIADYFRAHNMTFKPVAVETPALQISTYEDGRCDVVTQEPPFLAMARARLKDPADHVILSELLSKSDMGPIVRSDDRPFSIVARSVHFALVTAEELGINASNVETMKASDNPAIRRFLGVEGGIGSKMGLSDDFTVNVIKSVGNYGEVWERNFGMKSPGKLERGINALVRDGGLQWAPSWR
jgi:general L-amino acid transport system substrate-binding protein